MSARASSPPPAPEGILIVILCYIVTKDTCGELHQHGTRSSSVTVQCVHVDISSQDGQQRTYDQADVEVQFSSSEGIKRITRFRSQSAETNFPSIVAAGSFHRRVEDMRRELIVLDLVQPRKDEATRLHLYSITPHPILMPGLTQNTSLADHIAATWG